MSAPHRQNIGNPERIVRVVVGNAFAILGIVVIAGGAAFWGVVGALLALATGVDLIVTGARGYCPLYGWLGHVPKSLTGAKR